MVQNCPLEGLLPIHIFFCDGKSLVRYRITGFTSLTERFDDNLLRLSDIRNILYTLRDICQRLPEYLLSSEDLLLDPEKLFISPGSSKIHVCYIPGLPTMLPSSWHTNSMNRYQRTAGLCLMPSLGRSKASPVPTRIWNLRLLPFRHRTFHPEKVPHLLFRTLPNPEFPQHRPPMQRNLPLPLTPIPLSQTPAARRPGQRSRRSSGKGWSMTEKP